MIAQVLPLIRLPRDKILFDYAIPVALEKTMQPGHLVQIPFRHAHAKGIVIHISNEESDFKGNIKPISRCIVTHPICTSAQIALLSSVAKQTISSPGLLFRGVIPEIPKKIHAEKDSGNPPIIPPLAIPRDSIEKIKSYNTAISETTEDVIINYDDVRELFAVLFFVVRKEIELGHTTILLTPWRSQISVYQQLFAPFAKKIAVLHRDSNKNEYWRNWQKIQSGQAQLILGTRNALFAPVSTIHTIIFDNEHSEDYKQSEQHPYFDPRDAIDILKSIHTKARIIMASPASSVETYERIQQKKMLKIALSPTAPIPSVIDLKTEVLGDNTTPLSTLFLQKASTSLQESKKVLLFVSRKGLASKRVCAQCTEAESCPTCKGTLQIYPAQTFCVHCQQHFEKRTHCASCNNTSFTEKGIRIQGVVRHVQKAFPSARVIRLDADADTEQITDADSDIIVCTTLFLRKFPYTFSSIGLVCIVHADSLLYQSEFRSAERAYDIFRELQNVAAQNNAAFLIQTYSSDNYVLRSLQESNPRIFFEQEITSRKLLHYPPYAELIRLSRPSDSDASSGERFATELQKKLTKEDVRIIGPYPITHKNKKYDTLLIQYPKSMHAVVTQCLLSGDDTWSIDVNPQNIYS